MEDYLKGYLEVLPASQRRKIEEVLRDNQNLYNINSVTEDEFKEIINRLAEDHRPLTEFTPQVDRLDDNLYNAFFTNAHVDLNLLFLEELMIESATTNYERIFDGIIGDLDKEVKSLKQRVESLRLVSEGEDGLIVHKRSFESPTEMEDRTAYANLFVDRDGSAIESVQFERKHDQYFIGLSKTKELDALRNGNVPTATIKIEDRRGLPVQLGKEPERYKLQNAIDGDPNSYWAEVVLAAEPITSQMKKG